MKKLVGILSLFAALSAHADGNELVKYDYAKPDPNEENSMSETVIKVEVTVDEEGFAYAKSFRVNTRTQETAALTAKMDKLHPSTFGAIKRRVEALTDASVTTATRRITCKRMPRPFEGFRNLYVRNADGWKRMMSNEGCWLRTVVRPTNKEKAEKARDLKGRLLSIGDDMLEFNDEEGNQSELRIELAPLGVTRAVDLVKYEYAAGGRGPSDFLKVEVTVDERGLARAESFKIDRNTGEKIALATESRKLPSSTFRALKTRLAPLYDARLKTVTRARICMPIAKPTARYTNLYVRHGDDVELRLVSSPGFCWMRRVTRPVDDTAFEKALDLKVRLKNIGNDLLDLE